MAFKKITLTFLCAFIMLIGKAQNLVPFKDANGKFGFKDAAGKLIIKPIYADAKRFSEGLGAVTLTGKSDGKILSVIVGGWGFIDKTGRIIIPLKYDDVNSFKDGIATIKLNNKWGGVDKTGTVIIPFNYDVIYDFSENLAAVVIGGKMGFIDKSGELVIPAKFDKLTMEDRMLKAGNFLYTFYDKQARVISGEKIRYLEVYGEFASVPNLKMGLFTLLGDARTNFERAYGKLKKRRVIMNFMKLKHACN